jgi:hypothetical protein
MPFQKVEFEFPDEKEESIEIEIEPSSAEVIGKNRKQDSNEIENEVEVDVEPELEIEEPVKQVADNNNDDEDLPDEPTKEELDGYSKKVNKRIAKLTAQRREEARQREELERFSRTLLEENKKLKGTVNQNQEALLEQAKKTAAGEMIIAKRQYKQAYEAGDADKLLEAQEKLTNAKIKADRLNNLKPDALQEVETPVQTVEDTQQNIPAPVDERASDWAKYNTWFGNDDEMTSFALGLHTKLVKLGVDPQSNEYYERIDSRMREVFPGQFEDELGEVVEKPKRQSNVVAPATRSTAPRKIRLSPTQLTLAKRLGLTPKQYADQVALEQRKANG